MTTNDDNHVELGGTWILYRWKEGTNVITPYLVLSSHVATHNPWVARDWERIAAGGYSYVHTLKRMLNTEAIHDNERTQQL